MKFTLSWLKDHLDTQAQLADILQTLTMIGLEVESVENRAEALAPFLVAEIANAEPHPEADRLKVCRVRDGHQEMQIVCGAPNARTGLKVVLAPLDSVIPTNGMVIKKVKIRGVESSGMLCSARELGIGDDHDGIMELPSSAEIGKPFAPQFGFDDPVIEINITPDRGDALGVRGIARDLAAAGLGMLKPLDTKPVKGTGKSPVSIEIKSDGNSCRMFVGRHFSGVKNGASPERIQRRLKAVGLRPISALVDMTNYMTVDLGRPLHVYDADKTGGKIIVHQSKGGECVKALNDKEYTLPADVTVIDDAKGQLGVGGIVGGVENSVTETTKNVFLECAWFDPAAITQAGRKLSVHSDARHRFERGVDTAFLKDGVEIATRMILEFCGGEAGEIVVAGSEPEWKRSIGFRPARVKALGGVDVPAERSRSLLEMLGNVVEGKGDEWKVVPPSWRSDITIEADLVEEVLRLHGFDHIPATPLPKPGILPEITLPLEARRMNATRHALAAAGYNEVKSWSFVRHEVAESFGGKNAALQLENPISADLDRMRPSLIPNLLDMAKRNRGRGADSVTLCEVGLIWYDITPEGQRPAAAGVKLGPVTSVNPHEAPRAPDLFDAKADALLALEACDAPVKSLQIFREAPDYYHPGRSGALKLGKAVLGYFGELHPARTKAWDLPSGTAIFELFLDAVPAPKGKSKATRPAYRVSDLPAVERDFSFLLESNTPAGDLLRTVAGAEKTLITDVSVLSTYQDAKLKAANETSIALRVRLQPQQATFTEAEINAVSRKIVEAAGKVKGVRLSEGLAQYISSLTV